MRSSLVVLSVLLLALTGCSGGDKPKPPRNDDTSGDTTGNKNKGGPGQSKSDEDAVWDVWNALRKAVKANDYDAVWNLLDEDTQQKAEEVAKKVQDQYKNGDASVKSELSQRHGFTASDFDNLNGKGYVRSKVFWYEVKDLPDSTPKTPAEIDSAKGTAIVRYVEKGETKVEELHLVKEDDGWKVEIEVNEMIKPSN
jgi:hypothetical protein